MKIPHVVVRIPKVRSYQRALLSAGILLIATAKVAFAWNGIDVQTGQDIEIATGTTIEEGQNVEIFDYQSDEYREVLVITVRSNGHRLEIEVLDKNVKRTRMLELWQ
ncbi:DUF5334 family protein [Aminobacter anthyllidis]|uniref:DUF5334 family protein n=1 Tax=Aminobacter anthyllidis TaxID=1035067 RepID=UPI0024585C11|nr:DUF5334 family protein [Aminobacter anthyllidis]MDH4984316.1 DUF5334 family protein [Aminobacter anthyllidis]